MPWNVEDVDTKEIDESLLFRRPGFEFVTSKKHRILLLDQGGRELAKVRGMPGVVFGGEFWFFPWQSTKEQTVAEAIHSLGENAREVAFILIIQAADNSGPRVTVGRSHGNASIVDILRRYEARITERARQEISPAG